MLGLTKDEALFTFQYHKPALNPLSYLPPTRAKGYVKVNTSTKHTKSLNVYLKYNKSSTEVRVGIRRSNIHSPIPQASSTGIIPITADKSSSKHALNQYKTHQIPYKKSSTDKSAQIITRKSHHQKTKTTLQRIRPSTADKKSYRLESTQLHTKSQRTN